MQAAPQPEVHEEESYFVSMTDIMIGLVFIFVILLMFFAMRLQEATAQLAEEQLRLRQVAEDGAQELDRLRSVEEDRDRVLTQLEKALKDRGITVQIIRNEGVLRLPEAILFERSQAELLPRGQRAIAVLGGALSDVLPCFTRPGAQRSQCSGNGSTIEAVLVEGHTDKDALHPGHPLRDNLNLSAQRALNTFRSMMQSSPELSMFQNAAGQPVFSVSGYGDQRPINDQRNEDEKKLNRRIDLRILMSAPRSADAKKVQDTLEKGLSKQ